MTQNDTQRYEQNYKNKTPPLVCDSGWGLVTTAGFSAACCPINDDETQAHYHEQDTKDGETDSLQNREREKRSEKSREKKTL